jgi:hypothetical protein
MTGALFKACELRKDLIAYKTLDEFVASSIIQSAIKALSEQIVSVNLLRAVSLLPSKEEFLSDALQSLIFDPLSGREVRSRYIPDDHEATILGIGVAEDIEFNFEKVEYYGANEIGVAFETNVPCSLNYSIYKTEYELLDEEKARRILITKYRRRNRNNESYNADEDYMISVKGTLTITIPLKSLSDGELLPNEVGNLISGAFIRLDVSETLVLDTDFVRK